MTIRERLVEQLGQVEEDIDALGAEVAAGDLDDDTAADLRRTYEAERRRIEAELGVLTEDTRSGPDRRRVFWGAAATGAALIVITVFLLAVADDRAPGELATGGIAGDVATGAVDLDDVTNEEMEEVVAENPEVTGMRLALARRYFAENDFTSALGHYLTVLEQDPANPEALATVGWMSFLSHEPDLAESYVMRALDAASGYPEALWFLANIRLYGLEDPGGAVAPLEELLALDGLPEDVRSEAEVLLEEARGG